jgi:phage terminase large subunit
MEIIVNRKYKPVFNGSQRYYHLWGGRGRGATHFSTDYTLHLLTQPQYFHGGFFRATFKQIKTGLWQALLLRIAAACNNKDLQIGDFAFNHVELRCTYKPTGNSVICKGFRTSTLSEKANMKGIEGLTHIIIDEAEDIEEDEFNKLDDTLRTTQVANIQIFFLFNPPGKNHWLIKRFYTLVPADVEGWYRAIPKADKSFLSIHSTYLDNIRNINTSTIEKYRAYGNPDSPYYNPEMYYRDVCGLVSEGSKGRIYTNVQPITVADYEALPYPEFYGLDFGYSSDPCAVVACKHHNKKLYVRKKVYRKELSNSELAELLPKKVPIYADSAEPKTINYLQKQRLNVIAAVKGPDSIRAGIKELQELDIYAVETDTELWYEFEQYRWRLDEDKNPTDQPEDRDNHLMDAIRYAYMNKTQFEGKKVISASVGVKSIPKMNSWNEMEVLRLQSELRLDDFDY